MTSDVDKNPARLYTTDHYQDYEIVNPQSDIITGTTYIAAVNIN